MTTIPEDNEEQLEQDKPTLKTLAAQYGVAKLLAHAYHHRTSGPSFFADHEFLGELYVAYDTAFDALCERAIGLGECEDSTEVFKEVCEDFQECVDEQGYFTGSPFAHLLDIELAFQLSIKELSPAASLGTQNLLAQLADDSEARCYKLSQRIAAE